VEPVSALAKLAAMLGVGSHQAEDALYSERAARAVLARRDFLAAGAAMATGAAFSELQPAGFFVQNTKLLKSDDYELLIRGVPSPGLAAIEYSFDSGRTFSRARAVPPSGNLVLPEGSVLTLPRLRPGESLNARVRRERSRT
jgi:hypothetical protein